ncbi:peptidylprolyl isomerase [Granulicella sibirica]|uniref:Peptidyl-prolyl cis-trans isomerase n=1 Tax=Granulicella sibirica TaxID=2479048 RepID=A0A4Q0T462_9BACT|nr:peptidylprolyl isomerase [Granulicella sibirica]RXH56361.1 Peptidyl-prolyl cis-trans isomerase [Granulicella sibirica]
MLLNISTSLRLLTALAVTCAIPTFAQTTPDTPQQQTPPPANDLPDSPSAVAHLVAPAVPTGPTAVIDTTMGRLTCRFFSKEAPIATANFVGLATGTKEWVDENEKKHRTRFYDGTTFHRVIPDFMIQGGDPKGDGTGDPGYFFQDETDPGILFDVPGRLAMANSGPGPTGQGTNGSQFFVTEVPTPHLNGKHTIFGQCDPASVAIVTSITHVDRDANDKPRTPILITHVTIVPEGQPLPPAPAAPATPALPPTVPH